MIQLDAELTYPSTNRRANQLATFEHIGILDALPGRGEGAPHAWSTRSWRGRAWNARALVPPRELLHVPPPTGPGRGPEDFRFGTPAHGVGACGATPTEGDLGIAGAKLIAPTDPRSIVSARMRSTGPGRMPPLATRVVHGAGADPSTRGSPRPRCEPDGETRRLMVGRCDATRRTRAGSPTNASPSFA